MLNIKKQHKAMEIETGDFLCDCPEVEDKYGVSYSCRYLKSFIKKSDTERLHPIPISNFGWQGYDSWKILLEMLKVDIQEIQEHFKSKCPWSDNVYYRFYPDWLLVQNIEPYTTQKYPVSDFFFDGEFFKRQHFDLDGEHLDGALYRQDNIASAMMGHGYMGMIFPNDGGGDKEVVGIELTNHDLLIGHAWIWYNK